MLFTVIRNQVSRFAFLFAVSCRSSISRWQAVGSKQAVKKYGVSHRHQLLLAVLLTSLFSLLARYSLSTGGGCGKIMSGSSTAMDVTCRGVTEVAALLLSNFEVVGTTTVALFISSSMVVLWLWFCRAKCETKDEAPEGYSSSS